MLIGGLVRPRVPELEGTITVRGLTLYCAGEKMRREVTLPMPQIKLE